MRRKLRHKLYGLDYAGRSLSDKPKTCALCDRPLGTQVQQHHVIPKSKGGRETVSLHPICHRKIHKRFTNTELAEFGTLQPVVQDPEVARFIRWLDGKPPDFHRRTR